MFLIIEFVLLINIFGFFFKPHAFFFLNLIINFFIFISLIAAIVVEILSLQFRNVTFVLPILSIIAIIIMPIVLIKTKKIYRSLNCRNIFPFEFIAHVFPDLILLFQFFFWLEEWEVWQKFIFSQNFAKFV